MDIGDLIDYAPVECLGEQGFDLDWHMTRAERFALLHLLKSLKPEVSLEIGTYRGGSLQAISRYSGRVVSLDIDPAIPGMLAGRFPNVSYETGDSTDLLSKIIQKLQADSVGFILIDGGHTEEYVRHDINAVLKLCPKRPIGIVMHDSFMPTCRTGMRTADWASCPHVHYVELDFVPGCVIPNRDWIDGRMVGGFGFALLRPEPRKGELEIFASQEEKFEIVRGVIEAQLAQRSSFVKRGMRRALRLIS